MTRTSQPTWKLLFLIGIYIIAAFALMRFSGALPSGALVVSNTSSSTSASPPGERNDSGGTITTLVLSTTQQDTAWKAYVGNISGMLTLDDASGATIYNWQLSTGTTTGEVYASRSSSVTWSVINCSNQSHIDTEQTALSFASSDADSINKTFNGTAHTSFIVNTRNMTGCRYTPTYVNDSAQPQNTSALFQEVLLSDGSNFVYSTIIESGQPNGYNSANNYHFQMIVAQSKDTITPTPYYFYIELG